MLDSITLFWINVITDILENTNKIKIGGYALIFLLVIGDTEILPMDDFRYNPGDFHYEANPVYLIECLCSDIEDVSKFTNSTPEAVKKIRSMLPNGFDLTKSDNIPHIIKFLINIWNECYYDFKKRLNAMEFREKCVSTRWDAYNKIYIELDTKDHNLTEDETWIQQQSNSRTDI